MGRIERREADTAELTLFIEDMELSCVYFDTSPYTFQGRRSDVFGYKIGKGVEKRRGIDSGAEIYDTAVLMDESRDDYSSWNIFVVDPGETGDGNIKQDFRSVARKYYGPAIGSTVLEPMEQDSGIFKIEGCFDRDEFSMEKILSPLK